jgi:hypothetical protein
MQYVSLFLGAGFSDAALDEALHRDLAFIGADAGSIDTGPYQLAGQGTLFSHDLCLHDLRRILPAARGLEIPLLIGSCGGSGRDAGVDWVAEMARTVAAEQGLDFTMALIYSELDKDYLKDKVADGRVRQLGGLRFDYTAEAVAASTRTVGVMGAEPFAAALEAGADVVLAGRCTDPAIFAALPMMRGVPPGIAWQAAKLAECAGAVADPPKAELLHVTLAEDHFLVEPLGEAQRCTPESVGAQQLYETADPQRSIEPSGVLDLTGAGYTAHDERITRVSGGVFHPAEQYTVKLEGVQAEGYQTVAMCSYADPVLLADFTGWLAGAEQEIAVKVGRVYGERASAARLTIRPYGGGAGTALFPATTDATDAGPGREVFMLVDVVAPEQAMATGIANIAWHTLIHFPTKGWSGGLLTGAWPFAPPLIERGPVHRFNVNHAIEVDDPLEVARMSFERVGADR